MGSKHAKEVHHSWKIDRNLRSSHREENRKYVNVLLLGTENSGKSTLFNQVRSLTDEHPFTLEELNEYKAVIQKNVINGVYQALHFAQLRDKNDVVDLFLRREKTFSITTALNEKDLTLPGQLESAQMLFSQIGESNKTKLLLNEEQGEKKDFEVWEMGSGNYFISDNLQYFMNPQNLARITGNNYIPILPDILQSRKPTHGIVEHQFTFKGVEFRTYDIGGQKNERKKWIDHFDHVDFILFVVAINEYDLPSKNDPSLNCIEENVKFLTEILNYSCFARTGVVFYS